MPRYKLSRADLERQLADQLGSLQRRAHAFDEGYKAEAKQMATILRVLLHTKRHPSLLKQLGRDQIDFADSAAPPFPGNLATTFGLICLTLANDGVSYSPKLDDEKELPRVPFDKWWAAIVFIDMDQRALSRSDLVLTAADQDGGAHVDNVLREDYAALSRGNSLGWVTEDQSGRQIAIADPELAAIRQIAHEVLKTLVPGYGRTSKHVTLARKQPEVGGGRMRFYPSRCSFMGVARAPKVVAGTSYLAKVGVESISVGSLMAIVGRAASAPIATPGVHEMIVTAVGEEPVGLVGDHTDAVIDKFEIWPT